jgi:outer membrane protein insertion porin family
VRGRTAPRSHPRVSVALALLWGAGALVVPHRPAAAQPPSPGAVAAPADTATTPPAAAPLPRIASITLEGRARVDSLRIVRAFDLRPGRPYETRAVREGLLRLWATNLFDDLEVRGRTAPDGVHLVLHVAERPRIARISFTGNDKKSEEDLAPHLGYRAGDAWRPRLLVTARDSILAEYQKDGYRDVQVTATADSTSSGMWVQFAIGEGKKAQVTAIAFEGNQAFPADRLDDQLKSKKKGFPFKSGTVKEENLAEDLERLRTFYRENGYRDVRVERLPLAPDPKGSGVVLAHRIDEGPYYRMGSVAWEGNSTVPTTALAALPQPRPGGAYDGTRIRQAVEGAYARYAEEGYLYLQVDPAETVRDSNVVDVVFRIAEGPPSLVHQVKISGNTYTKENVIRRELDLREGDLFRRSRLVNTQQNVFRLGYFEDVGVDFQPAESTDVDIILRIKEKQTGTASAGAGYSSDGGLSGFVNLGHNNLFGNGQAVNIQLERGSTRRSVDLSFTDPWYRNTPLSLGGSAYYNEREIGSDDDDVVQYEEKRRGFSVQVGRPVPGIRYTRALARYRLEGTDISIGNESAASPSLRALATQGEQVTSGVELSLTRNSTNHPFYPSRGQKGTASIELAGGVLGGDYDFNKARLDSRWFTRSPVPGWATMFRLRGGVLASLTRGGEVPLYERFRLGGVTFDGLRGYDDYQIVPAENLSFPRFDSGSEVGLGNFGRLRTPYPGGRVFSILTAEQQFVIVNPVHGILFAEAGNTWNRFGDVRPFDLYKSAGVGVRVEVPILGNVGFDYAYGFDRLVPGWKGHFLFGAFFF